MTELLQNPESLFGNDTFENLSRFDIPETKAPIKAQKIDSVVKVNKPDTQTIKCKVNAKVVEATADEPTKLVITKTTELTELEMEKLDKYLAENKYNFRNILNQIMRVAILLHRSGSFQNQRYTQDKEDELEFEVTMTKSSYNSKKVLAVQITSGLLTIIGGALGVFAVFPALSAAASIITSSGQAATAGGQATSIFGKLCDNDDESQRTVHNTAMSRIQRKHDDSNKAHGDDDQLMRDLQRKCDQIEAEEHQAIKTSAPAPAA